MSNYKEALRENIWKLNVLFAVRGSLVHVGVLVIFLISNGLTLQEVLILQASWSIIQVILEIPSGYISDRWGRKPTVIFGTVCKFLGALAYCLGTNFWGFFLAVTLLSIGSSFFSGTMEALTYDTLKELDEERSYRKVAGKQNFFRFTSEAICSLIGGLLVVISLRAPLWGTLLMFSIGPIIAITLEEPRRKKLQSDVHLKAMLDIFVKYVVKNGAVRSILILNGIIITMVFSLFWFTQPYQEMVGLPLMFFGVTHAIIVLSHAFAARFVHNFEKWMDDRLLVILIAAITITCFLILGFVSAIWAIIFFFVARTMWGFTSPLMSDILNRLTPSDVRATVLSFRLLGFRLLFSIFSPFLGAAADLYSVNTAILIAGVVGGAAIGVTFLFMRPVWKQIPK